MEIRIVFVYNLGAFFLGPESQNAKAMDSKSQEIKVHLANDLHKIFAKNAIRFQGGFSLKLPSFPHFSHLS